MVRAQMPLSSRIEAKVLAWSLGKGMRYLRFRSAAVGRPAGTQRRTVAKGRPAPRRLSTGSRACFARSRRGSNAAYGDALGRSRMRAALRMRPAFTEAERVRPRGALTSQLESNARHAASV